MNEREQVAYKRQVCSLAQVARNFTKGTRRVSGSEQVCREIMNVYRFGIGMSLTFCSLSPVLIVGFTFRSP